jgi:CDP-glycerol glycerophosphotransferase (TagB/SpsB family)
MSWLNAVWPKSRKQVLFLSFPDLADNSFAFFRHLAENHPGAYRIVWLVSDTAQEKLYRKMIASNVDLSDDAVGMIEFYKRASVRGFFAFMRSRYVFFTHGFYNGIKIPPRQVVVNLWHGMPLKKLYDPVLEMSYLISTSDMFSAILQNVFPKVAPERVLNVGQPRCDLLFEHREALSKLGISSADYNHVVLWAPTFRKAVHSERYDDGEYRGGLPLISSAELKAFNAYLEQRNILMLVKLHHMDRLNTEALGSGTHIRVIKDADLLQHAVQFYHLLAETDLLITDFSSVYIDYLLTQKPIVFATDDIEVYRAKRGFMFDEPTLYMPGPVVCDASALYEALDAFLEHEDDPYRARRNALAAKMHANRDAFCQRLGRALAARLNEKFE